jgi:hypothetical protein
MHIIVNTPLEWLFFYTVCFLAGLGIGFVAAVLWNIRR